MDKIKNHSSKQNINWELRCRIDETKTSQSYTNKPDFNLSFRANQQKS